MLIEPGVYRSDVVGHLFILQPNPVRVTCIICGETCNRNLYKTTNDFKAAARAFVEKHGALDIKIANNIEELIPPKTEMEDKKRL